VTEPAWLAATLGASRPRVVSALLRHCRDLDAAEDAFQEASLRALERWPRTGAPRDPVAWLVLVARNAAIDRARRGARLEPLPSEGALAAQEDAEMEALERIEATDYRDDVLRLLFVCCHPELAPAQQLALALRVVSGLTVKEIARAFLVSEAAMEQRITRAKRAVAQHPVSFDAPGAAERGERIEVVAAALYALFNEGYSASGGELHVRAALCEEAIRLATLLVLLAPGDPELLSLEALFRLQHARTPARLDAQGEIVLLDAQDRARWDREAIAEGLARLEKARWLGQPGPYRLQAEIAAVHARAARAEDTDWAAIEAHYEALEALQPSPVVTLNRAVAVAKRRGPAAALALIAPLEPECAGYFNYYGAKGAWLHELGRDAEARGAWERALALARTLAEASHVRAQLDRLAVPAARAPGEGR
jgi:RNA polymerase sigma-70 factor (ECF subfamily)